MKNKLIKEEIKFLEDYKEQTEKKLKQWLSGLSIESQTELLLSGVSLLIKEGDAELSLTNRIKYLKKLTNETNL